MKKLVSLLIILVLAAVVLVAGGGLKFTGALAAGETVAPTVTVWPSVAELTATTKLVVMGSGFKPGQELTMLLLGADGTTTNLIDFALPKPAVDKGIVVDKSGNFACLVTLGGLDRVGFEGLARITVTDLDLNALVSAPIGFGDPNGRSRAGVYPEGKPDYTKNPKDPRPLPWLAPFFSYPKRP